MSDDLISRQAAIDCVNRAVTKEVARWAIKELPSAQETHDKRTETHACDLISRQAAIDGKITAVISGQAIEAIPVSYIKALPSAKPDEQCDNCHYKHIWMTQRMNGIDYPGHGGATA